MNNVWVGVGGWLGDVSIGMVNSQTIRWGWREAHLRSILVLVKEGSLRGGLWS